MRTNSGSILRSTRKGLIIMPKLSWNSSIAAGATFQPLLGWQYEYSPFGGVISILHRAVLTGIVATITTGSDTLQERSPVSAGGTDGVIPSSLDVPPLVEEVAQGDRLKILYENTSGAGVIVTGEIDLAPG